VVPEEDRGPLWLRDYGTIEADISRMEEFAAKLDADVAQNYSTHLPYIYDDMQGEAPEPHEQFPELTSFHEAHRVAARDTTNMVAYYESATTDFAVAAAEISRRYRDSDAFASATVGDVNAAFARTQVGGDQATDLSSGGTSPSASAPSTGSERA
jgi:hypothetical protein